VTGKSDRKEAGKFQFMKRYADTEKNVAFVGTLQISGSNQIISGDCKDLGSDTSGKFQLKLTDAILPNEFPTPNRPISKYTNHSPLPPPPSLPPPYPLILDQPHPQHHIQDTYNQDHDFSLSHTQFENLNLNTSHLSHTPNLTKLTYNEFTQYDLQYSASTDLKRVAYALGEIAINGKKFNRENLVWFVGMLRSEKAIDLLMGGLRLEGLVGFEWQWICEVLRVVGYSHTKMKVVKC
jgi:hypothetical protein